MVIIITAAIIIAGASVVYLMYLKAPEKPLTTLTTTSTMAFVLESPAFENGGEIPEKYTCNGLDISPPLRWSGHPPETKSLVLIVEDPDAPRGIFTHWIIYNIPVEANQLEEGVEPAEELLEGMMQGVNDFGRLGYGGPCPPPGKPHRYVFKLYALDTVLELGPAASREEVLKCMDNHILAEATLIGIYSRQG